MSISSAIRLSAPSSFYFGKIRSRGDFVKSTSGASVIALFDNWIAQGMEMLIAAPGWKTYYDDAGAIDFFLAAPHKRHAICGSLVPSSDASSRRFPFIAATLFETEDALNFLRICPLALEKHLNHQRALVHHASRAHDAAELLTKLDSLSFEATAHALDAYESFLTTASLTDLSRSLSFQDGHVTARKMILATGYLLEPMLSNYAVPPQKGISFPLPSDPTRLALVKSLWLDLLSIFLARAQFELSIFSCIHHGRPRLIVTFNGTTPAVFQALFEERAAQEYLIDVAESDWIEDHAHRAPATLKLSSYLEHENLSLIQMVETFRQAFSG